MQQIDARENYVDLNRVLNLPAETIDGLLKLSEVSNPSGQQVTSLGKVSLNISARNKYGGNLAPLVYNPKTFTIYNLESTNSQRQLQENLRKVVLTMREGEIAWLRLENNFHGIADHQEEAFFRLEVVKFEEKKKVFNEMNFKEQFALIETQKAKADDFFRADKIAEANENYHSTFCNFKGVPKKMRKTLSLEEKEQYKVLGLNLCRNFIRSSFKLGELARAKEVALFVFGHLDEKDWKTRLLYFDVLKKNGEHELLTQEIRNLDKEKLAEPFASEFRKIKSEVLKDNNLVLSQAFREALANQEKESLREKLYARLPDDLKKDFFE